MNLIDKIKRNIKILERQLKREKNNLKSTKEQGLLCKMKTVHNVSLRVEDFTKEGVGFEPIDNVENNFKFIYYKDGFKTTCIMTSKEMYGVSGVGVARCNSDIDEYNIDFGMTLANLRAKSDYYKKLADKYIDDYYDYEELKSILGGE